MNDKDRIMRAIDGNTDLLPDLKLAYESTVRLMKSRPIGTFDSMLEYTLRDIEIIDQLIHENISHEPKEISKSA